MFTFLAILILAAKSAYIKGIVQHNRHFIRILHEEAVNVWRNGNEMKVNYECLVVGDLIKITQGMRIPADCVLVSVAKNKCLEVDQTLLNGDSKTLRVKPLIEKNNEHYDDNDMINEVSETELDLSQFSDGSLPFLLGNTFVQKGNGKAIVLAVGK